MTPTAEQTAAIQRKSARLAIVAGAGSGKTEVLARRALRQIRDGAAAERMALVTFTTAAADELQDRIRSLSGRTFTDQLRIGTLHAWAYDVTRRNSAFFGLTESFSVYSQADADAVARMVAQELGLKVVQRVAVLKDETGRQLYQQRLRESNAVDYDALLGNFEALLEGEPGDQIRARTRHVLVDEAQDLDEQQHGLIHMLQPDSLTMVGDPRQAIFGWRGARADLFDRFCASADVDLLSTNLRSTTEIVELANPIHGDRWPALVSGRTTGPAVVARVAAAEGIVDEIRWLMAQGHKPGEIAILARTWSRLDHARRLLQEGAIPTSFWGPTASPWERPVALAIARWLRLIVNPVDANLAALLVAAIHPDRDPTVFRVEARAARVPLLRHLAHEGHLPDLPPSNYSSRDAADWLIDRVPPKLFESDPRTTRWCVDQLTSPRRRTLRAFSWWYTHARSPQDAIEHATNAVTLTTVHGAKGLAWPAVVVFDASTGAFDPEKPEGSSTLYVALTRARDRLHLLRPPDSEVASCLRGLPWA